MGNIKRCRDEDLKCRRGPSSYSMQDPELVFRELELKKGQSFFDLGCGAGDYAVQASKILGESGIVYALDIREEFIAMLTKEFELQKLNNLQAIVSDITEQLPINDSCIDLCLIATVLHMLNLAIDGEKIFNEVRRVIKPGGRVAVIECKKEDMHFGPPMQMRLSPEEIESIMLQCGFYKLSLVDLGYNYMIQFGVK